MTKTMRYLGALALLLALLALIQGFASAETLVVAWEPPGERITAPNATNGDSPIIRRAPNGELMIVYNHWKQWTTNPIQISDSDPYYSISTDGGQSWSQPAVISSPNAGSRSFASFTYDGNSTAHAIWVELLPGEPFETYRVRYARKPSGGNWTAPQTLFSASGTLPIQKAVIVESRPGILDAFWDGPAGDLQFDSKIWHSRSQDGGQTWSDKAAINATSAAPGILPAVAADSSGNLHVVWEQQAVGGGARIFYARGTGANSVSWSSTRPLPTLGPDFDLQYFRPDIVVASGQVQVAMVFRLENTKQTVYLTTCNLNQNCANATWSTLERVSGNFVGVNAEDPFFILPDLAYNAGTSFLHFHGTAVNSREIIWGTNSCEEWSENGRDQVTNTDIRSVNPNFTVGNGVIHLVYEQVDSADNHRIYYMNTTFTCGDTPTVYLPFITFMSVP